MDSVTLKKLLEFAKLAKIELIVGLIGLFLVMIGIFAFTLDSGKSSEIQIISATGSASDREGAIVVDVAGAVVKPGVYKLGVEARVGEAIAAAGGLTDKADQNWAAKSLNLAAKLSDGAKIYVPKIGEAAKSATGVSAGGTSAGIVASTSTVNINSATQAQLEDLPGIGPVTAGKIINARPYNSVEELLTRKIVSKSVYVKIKDLVSTF